LDELESHLSNRFISLDLQGFVPTLSKHAVREEREDGGAGGVGVGNARSPPRAIVGSTGGGRGGRGGHGHSHSLGLLGTGPGSSPGFEESTTTTTSTKTSDKKTVAERFIIPSPLNPAVTSSSSSALIPPPRPQFTPLPVPLPFPTVGGNTSSPSSGASGLALHRMRRESSNSPSSATAPTGPGTGRASPEIYSSSLSHRTSSHSPHPYPYPSSSLSSSPGALPIRRNVTTSGVNINPFKGNTLSSTTSASVSGSGSSPSLSIRQGLSLVGSSTRVVFPLPAPSPYGPSTPSSVGDRGGDWEREERDRRASNDGSSGERDRFRTMSMGGQEDGTGTGVPTRIPSITRKRYSSSFGNRYVGSVGSVGGVGSGESGRSTPASVSASTGATGGVGVLEDGKRKEQISIGVSCLRRFYFFTGAFAILTPFQHVLLLY
jgi:autophagy-related protein 13